jgi:hypothetical protein
MSIGIIPVNIYRAGGISSAFNITGATVVKPTLGCLYRIVIVTALSAGSLTINDCATTGAAAASNEIFTVASSYTAVNFSGSVINLEWPCLTGIVVSAVGTSGVVSIAYA